MAASRPRPGSRLFRTYGAAGGWEPRRRPGRAAAQWFQPQGRRCFFSSSSGSDGGPSPSVASDDPDDPDFPGSPVGRRRRRAGSRVARDPPSPTETPRRLRLRARAPQKCSTPYGPRGAPPFPGGNPGRLSPDLSGCGQPGDGGELGISGSLFSSPASPGPGSPAPGDGSTCTDPSASLVAASEDPSDFLFPAATLDQSPLPCPQDAATEGGRFARLASQARASLRSALFGSVDSGNLADSEFGADGKDVGGSCSRKRPETSGLPSTCKNGSTARGSYQETESRGTIQIEYEEANGCKGGFLPGETNRPKRTGPRRKRKHQETEETSLHHHKYGKGQKMGNGSFHTQDLTHVLNASSWTKTRASFSFHKKKIVTAVSEVCSSNSIASSLSGSLIAEYANPPVMNRTNSALSSWHSSSMHLLTPLKTLHIADKKEFDAEKVYGECNQEGPIPFSYCLPREKLQNCEKIGEGVFGEVFQINVNHSPVALKIMAIEGPDLVNGTHQKTFEEILPEIIISKELSLLANEVTNRTEGFIGLNSVHCVQGSYPPLLLRAWDNYNSTKGSANNRPDFFKDDQLFIVLEFEFGGTDLEQMSKKLSSLVTAKSILHQITASLAVAEASLHFEHRDLHWGNVLLKKTSLRELQYTLNGKTSTIPTRGLQVNIIDYTLSRLERDGIVVFCDISTDEDLFTGEGDYQFEIYRLMRKENNNCWGEYHPYNNVLWLHYLTDKILKQMTFKKKSNNPAMKQMRRKIQNFHRTMLNFSSATDLLCQHSLFN
ncbi:Serine/threonine-protein kinase haspin [Galemys pyrenaicus]|uniref:Serine/threonine-protein kinase haspin n=1 Tax=Galemys pyrenaicus TaxID=202257 RepID=A0A8J6A9P6_GALPY|nr:Serine/threonine-protein kinase haspin [Galemys pyrenaicus]